jgi:trehalose 6-phosphate synthase/phosphatase
MLLVSMEYTVCQTATKNPLILSEFVGVVGSLKAALKVNPWDRVGLARAIDYCLNMSDDEKSQRHQVRKSHTSLRISQALLVATVETS